MTRVRRPREQRDLLVGKASRSSRNMYITSTFLALLGFAGAQLMDGPGNGVAKSTYAATDPSASSLRARACARA